MPFARNVRFSHCNSGLAQHARVFLMFPQHGSPLSTSDALDARSFLALRRLCLCTCVGVLV